MKKTSFKCAFLIVGMIVCASILISSSPASGAPSVGVEEGEWMEYGINVTGNGAPPPTHDVRWMRITILSIKGAAFSANFTVRYANGTIGSAIWKWNFTEGNVEGWMIIPANLGPGDQFYDSAAHTHKPVNVTVQKLEQKIVLGATRTVTYGNDSLRHKEWDKATGVFVGSSEHLKNVTNKDGWYIEDLTVTINATATNMWGPQILGVNELMFYGLVATSAAVGLCVISSTVVIARRKTMGRSALPHFSQGKTAALTILAVTLFEVAGIFFFPFYSIGLSFAEINLIMQTIWTALVLVSIWFRTRANYFAHEITMLVVVCAWAIGFVAVLFMDPFSSSTEIFSNTPLRLVMNSLHGIFSVPALVLGVWLVVLWRPYSESFASKSRRIALLIPFFWLASYVVGVLDFLALHTTFFG